MSRTQPLCDSSHVGTNFKPLKFSLDEKASTMHLCGCKLSTNAPFCDKETCQKLMRGEAITEPAEVYSTDEYSEEDQDEQEGKDK